ncbi:MAG: glycosyltransferase [Candidatus Pacebacteria bacterium]|nr:glycosyltransferase [Candidatus Paceibacterota bacterium]
MTFLFFGIFDENYSRNRVLISGLEKKGYRVLMCRTEKTGLDKFIDLYKKYKDVRKEKIDRVIVAFPGHSVVWFAYLLFGKKVIFDMFVSMYNSVIEDRKEGRIFSFKAFKYFFLDWISLVLSPKILMDTQVHAEYVAKKFKIPMKKFTIVPVGSDDSFVFPVESGNEEFIVHFHGTGIPLQGFDYIKRAADIANDTQFHIYGIEGQNTKNVTFFGRFPYSDMSKVMAKASVVLGIFGDTIKTRLVVPNKVYEGWASKKAVITSSTRAIEEMSEEGAVALVKVADPEDLANKIVFLKNHKEERELIAKRGYDLFCRKYKPEIIVANMLKEI